jgi:hypothetical protein
MLGMSQWGKSKPIEIVAFFWKDYWDHPLYGRRITGIKNRIITGYTALGTLVEGKSWSTGSKPGLTTIISIDNSIVVDYY